MAEKTDRRKIIGIGAAVAAAIATSKSEAAYNPNTPGLIYYFNGSTHAALTALDTAANAAGAYLAISSNVSLTGDLTIASRLLNSSGLIQPNGHTLTLSQVPVATAAPLFDMSAGGKVSSSSLGWAYAAWFVSGSDSTAALLAFLNFIFDASNNTGCRGGEMGGSYHITGALAPNWSGASNFVLDFKTSTFVQQTDNVPILLWKNTLSNTNMAGWEFRGRMIAQWLNAQAAANTAAHGLLLSNTKLTSDNSFGWHNAEVDTIEVVNGFGCIGTDPAGTGMQLFYESKISRLESRLGQHSGILYAANSGAAGAPTTLHIEQMYAQSQTSALPMVLMSACDTLQIDQIERNLAGTGSVAAGQMVLVNSGRALHIGQFRAENEVYGSAMNSHGLVETNCETSIVGDGGIVLAALTINVANYVAVARQTGNGDGSGTQLKVGPVWVRASGGTEPITFTSGKLAIIDPGNMGGIGIKMSGDRIPSYPTNLLISPFRNTLVVPENTSEVSFYGTSVDGASSTALPVQIGGKPTSYIMPWGGRVSALSVELSAALTQGAIAFYVTINGTAIYGGAAIATVTHPAENNVAVVGLWNFSASTPDNTFNSGDVIGVVATASGSPMPASTDAIVLVSLTKGCS